MVNALQHSNLIYFAFESDISFYAANSYSRQPLKNTFEIQCIINGYSLEISMYKKTEDLENGIINFNSAPTIQFNGAFLEFEYSDLSENESTLVIQGDLRVLCAKSQKTFLGSIKKIDDVVFLKANLILDTLEFEFDQALNCTNTCNSAKTVSVEIAMKLKA